jgi:hypothetical protein
MRFIREVLRLKFDCGFAARKIDDNGQVTVGRFANGEFVARDADAT